MRDLDKLSSNDWDELFSPGVTAEREVVSRRYVLEPVDGDAKYVRRASELVDSRDSAHQDVQMTWPDFTLCLSHEQAVNVTLLLQEVSRHQVRSLVIHRVMDFMLGADSLHDSSHPMRCRCGGNSTRCQLR